jgi:hypothetical protein
MSEATCTRPASTCREAIKVFGGMRPAQERQRRSGRMPSSSSSFTGQVRGKSPGVTRELGDRLIYGYNQVLRPKLELGLYRYQEPSVDQFVARLSREGAAQKIPYALTGGPAADAMQHFYRSSEVPVFLDVKWHRGLRLLPDRDGPVVLLKPFGSLVYWREFDGKMVAPPWLVYAELLTGSDPRAREAAEELRREFLK